MTRVGSRIARLRHSRWIARLGSVFFGATKATGEEETASRMALDRNQRWFLVIFGLALVGWSIFGFLMAPTVIRQAHSGESLAMLNRLFESHADKPVHVLLERWQNVSEWIFLVALLPLPIVLTWPQVQTLLGRLGTTLERLAPVVVNSLLAVLGLAGVIYLLLQKPVLYIHFINENWWAEYGTFCSYLMAGLFLGWSFVADARSRTPLLALFALATLVIALEEIKWGQDVLGLNPPEVFVRHNRQGQITLHNMIAGPSHATAGVVVFLLSVALPIAARRMRTLGMYCQRWGVPLVPRYLWPFFLLATGLLLAPGAAMYLKFDEVAEFALAFATLAFAVHICMAKERSAVPTPTGYIVALGAVLLTLVGVSIGLASSVSSGMRTRLNDFATNRFPNVGLERQAETVFEYLAAHPEVQQSDTYVLQAQFLSAIGRAEDANRALERALAVQDSLILERPTDSEIQRNRLAIFQMLGRKSEAERAFQQAMDLDRTRLDQAHYGATAARVRWSMAQTLQQAGRDEAALEQIQAACAVVPEAELARLIRRWLEQAIPDGPIPPRCLIF